MQFDQLLDERKAESEAAVFARRRSVRLTESFEDVRQELRRDADPGVGDVNGVGAASTSARTVTTPPGSVNLIAFDNRFQSA